MTLGPTDVATCTIINNDSPARLTLIKEVENNFGHGGRDRVDAER